LSRVKHLLDINVLIALTQSEHLHFKATTKWFDLPDLDWGFCAFSQAGFLRLSANPSVGKLTLDDASQMLAVLVSHPGYRYWPITADWAELVAPFRERVLGHQQVADAWLLGLAIKENGVLVTLDKAIRTMAGPRYSKHVLVLET
jgi:toxin-antitoxin system PIN domain toxin